MLIIDKKRKDYYDGVVGTTGIDKTIVYNREFLEIEDQQSFPKEFISRGYNDKNPMVHLNKFGMYKNTKYHAYSTFIVGFCGNLYIGWKLFFKDSNTSNAEVFHHITYDFDYVLNYVKKERWKTDLINNVKYTHNYDAMNIFRKYKTPVFIYDTNVYDDDSDDYRNWRKIKFFVNPLLKDYEFYKVFDSFTTLQEIQMFLSEILVEEKEVIKIADKYKIEQHGFDKYSFRKDKEAK